MEKQPLILILSALLLLPLSAHARSQNAIKEFKRQFPCPVTFKKTGSCPGYEIDHRTPLKCGGADHHSNMQWLTKDEHRAKTAKEAKLCRRR